MKRRVVWGLLVFTLVTARAQAQQPSYQEPRHSLVDAEIRLYLSHARKAFIEVDDLSDARPVAQCFGDHLRSTTPFTRVTQREDAEIVLRFETWFDDTSVPGPSPIRLTALLQSDEWLWRGTVVPNPKYRGPDPSCDFADTLAGQLRAALREARDGLKPWTPEPVVTEELIWNTKHARVHVAEVNKVFATYAWEFTVHNGSATAQVFDGEVQLVDRAGNVVDCSVIRSLAVPLQDERPLTGTLLVPASRASVVDLRVQLTRRH